MSRHYEFFQVFVLHGLDASARFDTNLTVKDLDDYSTTVVRNTKQARQLTQTRTGGFQLQQRLRNDNSLVRTLQYGWHCLDLDAEKKVGRCSKTMPRHTRRYNVEYRPRAGKVVHEEKCNSDFTLQK